MQCGRCRAENREGRRFCGECGFPLATTCPSCRFANEGHERFCGGCGRTLVPPAPAGEPRFQSPETYTPKHLSERILSSRTALEGERKRVTVLFADLKSSMELLAERDPEDARAILDPVLELMMAAVHGFEGTVNQVMGDGIMALFGAPIAHEDHAVRACYAALRMQEAVRTYAVSARRSHGVEVQIRVGLNSGEVVVRSVGSDLRMEYSAIGQTTHLAARMEQLATPGTIRLTADTLRLVEGFVEVTPLGPVPVKGVQEPIDVFEVTGAGAARTRLQAAVLRGLSPFRGRDRELEQLGLAQQHAGEGRGQLVALVGEAGVGKSRLIYEFVHSPRLQGWSILEAAPVSYGQATSYFPVIDLLKGYFKIQSRDEPRAIREKVTGKVLTLDEALKPTLPALLSLLSVPADDDTEWRALDPGERRRRTLDAVSRLLLREAHEQPVLLIFEDLHGIDAETQAVLDGLGASLGTARLLLLATHRPEFAHAWSDQPHLRIVRLSSLPAESAGELLDALLGPDHGLAPLKQRLVEHGNPFFLEETVRTLVETNLLVGQPGRYRLTQPIHALDVPPTVQAVLAARIDRLAPEDKRLLQTASVVGNDVPLSVLQEIAELPDEALRRGLDRLRAAEFVYEAKLFPEIEYTFTHALTHEVAYGGLLHERRRVLHARIVEAFERIYADRLADHAERLADHALRGEVWDKAVRYLRDAVDRQAARSAYHEARSSLEAALRALARLPETRATQARAIDLRLDSRLVLAPLGQYDRILEYMREAEVIARQLGDQRRLGLVLADMGARLRNVGDHRRALAASQQALDIATELGERGMHIEARYRLAQAHFAVGEFEQAVTMFRRTIESGTSGGVGFVTCRSAPSPVRPRFLEAWPHAWLGLALGHLGRFGEAVHHAETAMRIAESADHLHTVIESYAALGGVHLERGELDRARRAFERGLALVRPQSAGDVNLLSGLGYTYALSGRAREAVPLLEDSIQRETSISAMGLGLSVRRTRLAKAYLSIGRRDDALTCARSAVELSTKHHERANQALALEALADITACDDTAGPGNAVDLYARSLALANELGMRPLVAHCRAGLGTLHRRIGSRGESDDHLAAAAVMYREMGMTYWLEGRERNVNG